MQHNHCPWVLPGHSRSREYLFLSRCCPTTRMLTGHCRQRSIRDGDLLQMGKDFRSADGLIGQNLADLVSAACQRKVSPSWQRHS